MRRMTRSKRASLSKLRVILIGRKWKNKNMWAKRRSSGTLTSWKKS